MQATMITGYSKKTSHRSYTHFKLIIPQCLFNILSYMTEKTSLAYKNIPHSMMSNGSPLLTQPNVDQLRKLGL